MSHSARFVISQAFIAALSAPGAGLPAGTVVRDNSAEPATLSAGPRIVFLKDDTDALVSQEGQVPKRKFRFYLGAICRTSASRADADELYEAAQLVVRGSLPAIAALPSVKRAGPLRELQASFELEGIDVGGALIQGLFEIDYEKPRV